MNNNQKGWDATCSPYIFSNINFYFGCFWLIRENQVKLNSTVSKMFELTVHSNKNKQVDQTMRLWQNNGYLHYLNGQN